MFLPYVYIVRHKITKEFYIGMRSANKVVAEEDLGVFYFTSSKTVKNNFENFDIEIVAYFEDQIAAFEFENSLIKEHWGNQLLLNKHYQEYMSKFSMTGRKRPDLSEFNKKHKSKPKESRKYQCLQCNAQFEILEFCHHSLKEKPLCSLSCAARYNGKNGIKHKGPNEKLRGRPTWNKGLPNPTSANNGRKGAKKLSATATGRKRLYKEDGSWTWQYPNNCTG
jgi:hypothetical protein